jgi:uncharacterized integral membrane protein
MSGSPRPRARGDQRNWKAILGVAGGVLLVWFIIANSRQVEVTWWVLSTSTSLVVVILVSALLGAGITYVLTRMRHGSMGDAAHRDAAPRRERPR